MRPVVIVGKHPSILKYPSKFWGDFASVGINHAAVMFNTDTGFTGHIEGLAYYKNNNFQDYRVITTDKTFENTDTDGYKHKIRQRVDVQIFDMVDMRHNIEYYVKAAVNKRNIPYPNYWTALFLVIFYCIKIGHDKIFICGCNLEGEPIPGFRKTAESKHIYAQKHLNKMIKVAKKYNINIIQCLSYDHYLEKIKLFT